MSGGWEIDAVLLHAIGAEVAALAALEPMCTPAKDERGLARTALEHAERHAGRPWDTLRIFRR